MDMQDISILSERMPYILEIYLLHEFPVHRSYMPVAVFNPKWIIEEMMRKHGECIEMIWKNLRSFEGFVYYYHSNGKLMQYIFSNNMMFYLDIVIIRYLYHIIENSKLVKTEPLRFLIKIMMSKYDIRDKNEDIFPEIITFYKIAHSFPSITSFMFNYNLSNDLVSFASRFTDCTLHNVFCSPWLAAIIPKLDFNDDDTPFVFLLTMNVLLDAFQRGNQKDTYLYLLYQRIHTLLASEIFPIRLKLELCWRGGIVEVIGNIFQYASVFRNAREKAIELISNFK